MTVERTDSAGASIVISRSPDVPLAWRFEQRLRIGSTDEGPASFGRLHPDFVAVDGTGRIVVLDADSHRLLVFDSTGAHLATIGKKGGGPGELEFPNALALDTAGNAVVFDFAKRELTRFTLDGRVLEGVPRPEERPMERLAFTSQGAVFSWHEGSRAERSYEAIHVMRDSTPERVLRVERPPMPMVMFESCRIGLAIGPLFAPRLAWTARDDRIIATAGDEYVVDLYEGTSRIASFRREVPTTPTTRAMAERELDGGMRVRSSAGECTVATEEVIEKRGMAATLPAISRLALSPHGAIWVARGAVRGDTALVDVLSAAGEYVGTLPHGTPFPAAFLPNGDIVAVERDELDVPSLAVYRVTGPVRVAEEPRRSGA